MNMNWGGWAVLIIAIIGFVCQVAVPEYRRRAASRVTPVPPLDPQRVAQMMRDLLNTHPRGCTCCVACMSQAMPPNEGLLPPNEPYLFVEGDSDKEICANLLRSKTP